MHLAQIITSEPDYIKAILATQFDDFEKGPEIRHVFNPLLGTGVFAADGELWKSVRFSSSLNMKAFIIYCTDFIGQ